MHHTWPRRLLTAFAAAGLTGGCLVAQATSAIAASPSISRVTFTSATHSSLTFTVSGHASKYRVYVAQVHHQLTASNLHNDPHSGWSTSPTVTVTGLSYSTTPWFYRAVAQTGTARAYSAEYGPVGLQPTTPTAIRADNQHGAVTLSWTGGAGTGYIVQRAADPSFSSVLKSYALIGPDQQFTPPDLTFGAAYSYRILAVNNGTRSNPSVVASANESAASTSTITTMTYNIREASLDGQPDGSNKGAPWDQRKGRAAALIRSASPDVIAVQEGASFVDGSSTERQADSLVSALGSPYKLARTEIPPTEPHYFRTGDYIIYNSTTMHADDPAGTSSADVRYWDLGQSSLGKQHWAAYQEFTDRASNSRFLFVAFHLVQVNNNPSADDAARQRQTESLLAQSETFNTGPDLPIVYAGDTNSAVESSHPNDGPRVAMRARLVSDAFDVAASRHHTKFNTGNQYFSKPPASRVYLDAIFAAPGVGVASWDELLKLSHGKFVLPIPSDHNPVVAKVVIPG